MNRHQLQLMRSELISLMRDSVQSGVDCSRCVGTCCTFVANSMAITEFEAQDIRDYLQKQGKSLEAILADVNETIHHYGLESKSARLGLIRKTYTCPFFLGHALGCSIAPESKPIGCLRFNPRIGGQTEGGNCSLSEFDHPHLEGFNAAEKKPIPVAIRDLLISDRAD